MASAHIKMIDNFAEIISSPIFVSVFVIGNLANFYEDKKPE
jgi:hypothetical protein